MALTFGQVTDILMLANHIPDERRSTFVSRLKQWQKMGFPEDVNVGRGVKVSYGAKQLYQLGFMIRLLRVGLTPERAQTIIRQAWPAIRDGIVEATECTMIQAGHYHYLLVQLDALSQMQDPTADHMHVFVSHIDDELIVEALDTDIGALSEEELQNFQMFTMVFRNRLVTCITIEVDSILLRLLGSAASIGIDLADLAPEVMEWERERRDRGRAEQSDKERHHNQQIVDNLEAVWSKYHPAELAALTLGKKLVEAKHGDAP